MIYYRIEEKVIQSQVVKLKETPINYAEIHYQEGLQGELTTLFPEMLPDYIFSPYPMISNDFLEIIQMYQLRIPRKFVSLEERQTKNIHSYWAVQPKVIDCLHPDTEMTEKGEIKQLVLKAELLHYQHFFAVAGLKEGVWIASLEVIESLLRRGMNGFVGKAVILR